MEEMLFTIEQIVLLERKIVGSEENPGILSLDLIMSERFWINDLLSQIRIIRGAIQNLRDETVRMRGVTGPDGMVTIKATEKIRINVNGQEKEAIAYTDAFLQFESEYAQLMSEKYPIRVKGELFEKYFSS
jgi:CYTH domain-containing protein